MDMMIVRE